MIITLRKTVQSNLFQFRKARKKSLAKNISIQFIIHIGIGVIGANLWVTIATYLRLWFEFAILFTAYQNKTNRKQKGKNRATTSMKLQISGGLRPSTEKRQRKRERSI